MPRRLLPWLLLLTTGLVLALSLGACRPQGPNLVIRDPWARSSPMMAEASAVYMVIANQGHQADALVGVEADIATMVEIHETVLAENGVMKMQPVPGQRLEIPAGQEVALQPQGLHIMLMGLKQPLEPGMIIHLTLHFERSGAIQIEVPVRAP